MQSGSILAARAGSSYLGKLLAQPAMIAAASRHFSLAYNAKSRFEAAYRKKME